jgi:DNA-binding NarL/FixJ family response regulator
MRVLVADAQMKVRSALRLILEQELGLSVVGEANEVEDLFAQAETIQPDLVLLDWELPGRQVDAAAGLVGPGLLATLRSNLPHLRVIALSGRPEAHQVALAAGADVFVSKGDLPERLLAAVRDCCHRQYNKKAKGDEK